MFGVYFDYKDAGEEIVLCTTVHDGVDVILQNTKNVPKGAGFTNYECTLEAWKWATQIALDEDFDEVTFYNQNKLIFDWAVSGKYSEARQGYYRDILGNIQRMVEFEYQVGFEVVKGEKNLAKKHLKKMGTASVKGSFNGLFSQAKQVQQPTRISRPQGSSAARSIDAERQSVVPFKRKQA